MEATTSPKRTATQREVGASLSLLCPKTEVREVRRKIGKKINSCKEITRNGSVVVGRFRQGTTVTSELCFALTGQREELSCLFRYSKMAGNKLLQFEICVVLESNKICIKPTNMYNFQKCKTDGMLA
jgi:hypothetical protein